MIPLTLLRVPLVPERPWRLPPYAGVTLRGALGHAFRQRACQEPARAQCAGCPRFDACAVPGWYDPGLRGSGDSRPIALRVDGPRDVGPSQPLVLAVNVIGDIPAPDALLGAIGDAAAAGLGRDRIPHHVGPIAVVGVEPALLAPGQRAALPAPARLSDLLKHPPRPTGCLVRFRTPFRWSKERPADVSVTPDLLFRAAIARLRGAQRLLGLPPQPRFDEPDGVRVVRQDLRWFEGGRRSRRQDHEWVWLGGVVGRVRLEGELAPMAPLLAAAEVLQLGRATSAGLGVVEVTWD